jgi:hypothetical protein
VQTSSSPQRDNFITIRGLSLAASGRIRPTLAALHTGLAGPAAANISNT